MNNLYKRLARAEAMADMQRGALTETLENAYRAACESQDAENAAALARKLRDKLLKESDAQMTLDRLGLDTSSATKFLASVSRIFSGDWAVYRQALRDVPEQTGFPFHIIFPERPDREGSE